MHYLQLLLLLFLVGCSSGDQEEGEVNVDNMVMQEGEWSTADLIPQESIISETPDAPTKQDPVDACR